MVKPGVPGTAEREREEDSGIMETVIEALINFG